MKLKLATIAIVSASAAWASDEFFDAVEDSLSFSAFDQTLRARVSGTLDLEFYRFQPPAPAFLYTNSDEIFVPRLTTFIDSQIGSKLYVFAQARVDRGFDPTNHDLEIRLDEYALRFTPWEDGRLSLQVGQFATIVGNWTGRHLSWDNPFITAPVLYENPTPVYDRAAPYLASGWYGSSNRSYEYSSIIWGPSYTSGVLAAGRVGAFEYAADVKNASLSSRPDSWNDAHEIFHHPTLSTRIAFRPNPTWNVGLSFSRGTYLLREATPTLPSNQSIGDYNETLVMPDITFAWRHLQFWAEFCAARFDLPFYGTAKSTTYYVELKYKFTPRFYSAIRWNDQRFENVEIYPGVYRPWSNDLSRLDFAIGFRVNAHTQLKLQYNLEHEAAASRSQSHLGAAQMTVRF